MSGNRVSDTKAIDCWVNVNLGELGTPDYLVDVAAKLFKRGQDLFRDMSIEETLDGMDKAGIEKTILTVQAEEPSAHVLSFIKAHPDRFFLGAEIDPRRGMKAIRALESVTKEHGALLARITPFYSGIAPSDAIYYPVYSKCIELDLPITINTGIPGPPAPARCQDPLELDPVCLHFPELKLVMCHGADPWWDVAMRLMLKYENLYLRTSAYLPKYLPPELIQWMNTRGKTKVIYASDHPSIPMNRGLEEAKKLEFRPGVLDRYIRENAQDLFFSKK